MLGVPYQVLLDELVEFYLGNRLDLVTKRIREKYNKGLSATDIVHLSILYTLLQRIDAKVDLS